MPSPSTSRKRGSSSKGSVSSTPARSSPSSKTPRQSRASAPQTSSPLFAQSSPSIGPSHSQQQNQRAVAANMNISSPVRQSSQMEDRETTPKANRAPIADSSPIRYTSSSSPPRNVNNIPSDLPSSSSGLFVRSDQTTDSSGLPRIVSRRGDIHSDIFAVSSARRRRIFVDQDGMPVGDVEDPQSGGTFSNLNPDTSDAEALGGGSTRVIWGTNISIQDSMASFKNFLRNYTSKYRLWVDGLTEEETTAMGSIADKKEYVDRLNEMRSLGVTGLNLDARNLKAYPLTVKLWHQLQNYPQEVIPIMDQSIKDIMLELAFKEKENLRRGAAAMAPPRVSHSSSLAPVPSSDPQLPSRGASGPVVGALDPVEEVEMRTYKVLPFGLDKTVNMRDLDPADLDKLVAVKGLVIRATPIIPDMKEAFFRCTVCNHTVFVSIDRGRISEPIVCPREACKSKDSMQIQHNRCIFGDKQVVKLQETPDSVPDGQTPHSVSLCAYEDLVDVCKAGDRIEVTGVFRCNPVRVNPRQRTIKSVFKTYVDVLHIQKVDKRKLGIDVSTVEQDLSEQAAGESDRIRKISATEEAKIKETAARSDVYDLLSRSLAPSIYEMDDVKKGILLQMFGGTNKSFEKGGSPKYRGDINVLLCGDPSTSKSQLLQYVHKIAPRGVYTSGKGSSAVGLTAYVTRDPESRQLVLESGALVLSDGGVCCIDEFDKMNDSTRSVLHEVMEQQTVSIAKAGIITTLNARTSILASANPIGSKYNVNLPVPQNIDLPPTLLSRFDLVYLVLDRIDEVNDRRLAKHLVGMYLEETPEHASSQEILPLEFLTTYISYARDTCHPSLTPNASSALVEAYVSMRKLGEDIRSSDRRITATTRQLESMIRLGEAHAKMRLSPTVTEEDVHEAVRLIKSAIKASATDARTGLIDMGLLGEGGSSLERKRRDDLKRATLETLDGWDGGVRSSSSSSSAAASVRYADLYHRVGEGASVDVDGADFSEAVRALEQEGKIQLVGEGARRMVRRVAGLV